MIFTASRCKKAERKPMSTNEKNEKSEDIFDRGWRGKQTWSKAQKREYAKEKHLEGLLQPPKDPSKLPAFLADPSLLPKRPPGR